MKSVKCENCGAERQLYHPCPSCGQPTFKDRDGDRDGLPRVGQTVAVSDPLGYSGHGTVVQLQSKPHEAVLVLMESITDRTDQTKVGQEVWVLAGHVTVICAECHQDNMGHRASFNAKDLCTDCAGDE